MKKNYDKWKGVSPTNREIIQGFIKYRKNTIGRAELTLVGEELTLRKLAKFHKNSDISKLSTEQIQDFFSNKKIVRKKSTADLHASHLMVFYQWIQKIPKNERPSNLFWYEYQKQKDKDRSDKPDKKSEHFITREEYDLLIQKSGSPQNRAIWELLYLSGTREGEIIRMTNKHVIVSDKGYEIFIKHSKTKPRTVALCEIPGHLSYWLRHHPLKEQDEFPLWISESNRSYGKPLKRSSAICQKLTADLRRTKKIEKPLTPHDFRRTRATIMFSENYTDKHMALFFGWRLRSVPMRREEYDLTDYNDLREKILAKSKNPTSYENFEAEKERQKQKHEREKEELRNQIDELRGEIASGKDKFNQIEKNYNYIKNAIEFFRSQFGGMVAIHQEEYKTDEDLEIIQGTIAEMNKIRQKLGAPPITLIIDEDTKKRKKKKDGYQQTP
jgi:integrase